MNEGHDLFLETLKINFYPRRHQDEKHAALGTNNPFPRTDGIENQQQGLDHAPEVIAAKPPDDNTIEDCVEFPTAEAGTLTDNREFAFSRLRSNLFP